MRKSHITAAIFVGLAMTHAQSAELISPSSQWQYYDKIESPAINWFQTDFDHSLWSKGFAQLGYGDGDEATVTSFGTESGHKPITQYFIKSFNITSLSTIDELKLRLLADDGAVVYINGVEAFRINIPKNQTHETLANDSLIDSVWLEKSTPKSLLREGKNLVAVEVHQISKTSSDISFDLALVYRHTVRNTARTDLTQHKSRLGKNGQIQLVSGQTILVPKVKNKQFSQQYSVVLGEGITTLDISTLGGSGDTDIYVKYGEEPTLADWDYRPFIPGNKESINYQTPKAGTYYIALYAYQSFADVQLVANWQGSDLELSNQ